MRESAPWFCSPIAHNEDSGRAAVAYASGIALNLSHSILLDNRALGTGTGFLTPSQLQLFGGGPHFMRQSTVVANPVLQMALLDGTSLDITGSIAHGSTMRVFRAANGGSLTHRGCLLIHPLQSDASLLKEIAPGFFHRRHVPERSRTQPQLRPHRQLKSARRLLHRAQRRRPRLQQSAPQRRPVLGVINLPFPSLEPGSYFVDLDAIELRDLGPIFKDGFEGP